MVSIALSEEEAQNAFKNITTSLQSALDDDVTRFGASGPEYWSTFRRCAMRVLSTGASTLATFEIDIFWIYVGRMSLLPSKRYNQQILEVVDLAAKCAKWAERFWEIQGFRLAVWNLILISKPLSIEKAVQAARALMDRCSSAQVAQTWLNGAPREFVALIQAAPISHFTDQSQIQGHGDNANPLGVRVFSPAHRLPSLPVDQRAEDAAQQHTPLRASSLPTDQRAEHKALRGSCSMGSAIDGRDAAKKSRVFSTWQWWNGHVKFDETKSDRFQRHRKLVKTLKSSSDDPVPDPFVISRLPTKVLLALLANWTLAPFLLLIGMLNSTCRNGLLIYWYVIPLCNIASIQYVEYRAMRELREIVDTLKDEFSLGGAWVAVMFQRVLRVCDPELTPTCDFFEHRYFLRILSFFSAADLATDVFQLGQVRQCELEKDDFTKQFAKSMNEVGVLGMMAAVQVFRMTRKEMLAGGNFPNLGYHMERHQTKIEAKIHVLKRTCFAAESATMFYISRVAQELAAELAGYKAATTLSDTEPLAENQVYGQSDGEEKEWKVRPTQCSEDCSPDDMLGQVRRTRVGIKEARKSKHKKQDSKRFQMSFKSIIRLVLLESAPSINLTVIFFCLELDHLGPVGKAKTILSVLVSGASSLALSLCAWRGGWKGKVLTVVVFVMVVVPFFKLIFAFLCESHFYSAVTFRCVEKV